jgi:GntR family transcriptional regulator
LQIGQLRKGDQLPRIKDVVASLSINPNTVLKAYKDLEQQGIAKGRPGQGTFIEASPETVGLPELAKLRRALVSGWLPDAAAAGLDEDGIVALFTSALRDFRDHLAAEEPVRRGGRRTKSGQSEGAA